MDLSLDQFNTLDFEAQIVAVWDQGRFIATRYEEEDTVGLYYMRGGFFVELFYNSDANHIVDRTRPFLSHDRDSLEDYAVYVNLDDLGLI
ncbi:hypothetical protein [Hymenobacter actinosclerus]|uniref:Uncharacterized protein n=1 Tax=Hymenobacter actinosclerus TaxID=82805 RepID=A0A1I0IQ55_9BACT|nr:hypothetical protein [Hymenobacter actinosclerus]SET99327.1 hypothetical protein SAMN04487998_3445 [Hymenobacter actinosclerus]